ncbi:hypothetical protein CJ469_06386 [Nocardia farcinica]|nr:hypothetical protein CJ469_06386 [Nocardia farcinica]PFW99006.1 hypothetical protein CJ468_06414 [Nocardia farcinica]
MRSALVKVPVFSAHAAAGNTTSASCAVSVRKMSCTTRNSRSWASTARMRDNSGSDTAGLVPLTYSSRIEPSSA